MNLPLIPLDKQAHFLGGYSLSLTFGLINPLIGLAVVVLAAIGKEVYDYYHPLTHTPDIWDIVATVSGGLIPFCGLVLLH